MSDQKIARAYDKAMEEIVRLEAEIERLELEVAAWKQASDLKAVEIERLRALASDKPGGRPPR
jgi:hypothetical protein